MHSSEVSFFLGQSPHPHLGVPNPLSQISFPLPGIFFMFCICPSLPQCSPWVLALSPSSPYLQSLPALGMQSMLKCNYTLRNTYRSMQSQKELCLWKCPEVFFVRPSNHGVFFRLCNVFHYNSFEAPIKIYP